MFVTLTRCQILAKARNYLTQCKLYTIKANWHRVRTESELIQRKEIRNTRTQLIISYTFGRLISMESDLMSELIEHTSRPHFQQKQRRHQLSCVDFSRIDACRRKRFSFLTAIVHVFQQTYLHLYSSPPKTMTKSQINAYLKYCSAAKFTDIYFKNNKMRM